MIDISFLLGTSVVAVLIVQVLKSLFGSISERWGSLISQVILLTVAVFLAVAGFLVGKLPPEFLQTAGLIFGSAMIIYEVLYKAIWQQAAKNLLG